ncbi:hypothetical protein EMIT0194MI4_20574 [Pseudomonas sp. IT-194MI4]
MVVKDNADTRGAAMIGIGAPTPNTSGTLPLSGDFEVFSRHVGRAKTSMAVSSQSPSGSA